MNYVIPLQVLSLAVLLAGCSHQPKQVDASRALVSPTTKTELRPMPANQQQALNTLRQGASLSTSGGVLVLGQRYISALGRECTELLLNTPQGRSQRSVACKIAAQWYLIPQLEQASLSGLYPGQSQ